mmetsp:Transcript_4110/g.5591  ORF Transcript_4110/g.5591 Transcript_4110/m.5591 type:complete len:202 (+) Transcript_4110:99-704(+)|eukprot:CAMPEP_0116063882 /NCGR_PEP_ID=MMETSP0322-20121206/8726_1 /TAXON_ID=163516 /ORGANISM="Leptocylindrus danicus var. apora, Strain B651" /LENGTH=201 /DNA_ID=CAMNT_0003549679 /DNA_START=68 /DNA_END=673 /DNA_ORIENTATION=+
MVKHNNVIQNIHLRKKYCASSRGPLKVRLALNQAGKKKSRRIARAKKAAAIAPLPLQKLRPLVHCPTQRYNMKVRLGRGFSLEEIKGAGLESAAYARSVGIAVDKRRTNKSEESYAANVDRLKAYMANLVVLSSNAAEDPSDVPAQITGTIMPIEKKAPGVVIEDIPEKGDVTAFTQMKVARKETVIVGQRIAVEIRKSKD